MFSAAELQGMHDTFNTYMQKERELRALMRSYDARTQMHSRAGNKIDTMVEEIDGIVEQIARIAEMLASEIKTEEDRNMKRRHHTTCYQWMRMLDNLRYAHDVAVNIVEQWQG